MSRLGGCFPGSGLLDSPGGPLPMARVRPGDLVAVMGPDGAVTYSPVLMMLHAISSVTTNFVSLRTGAGRALAITTSHLLMRRRRAPGWKFATSYDTNKTLSSTMNLTSLSQEDIEVVYADRIEEDDYILVTETDINTLRLGQEGSVKLTSLGSVTLERVVRVSVSNAEGIYAPLTAEGNIVVDGVVTSCYAVIDSQTLAHWAFLPVRVYYSAKSYLLLSLQALGFDMSSREGVSGESESGEDGSGKESLREWKPRRNAYVKVSAGGESGPRSREVHIHWYPRILYFLARLILPSHLVHS